MLEEWTIYSKYSNERAERFCIRTDIVLDAYFDKKKVYKYALSEKSRAHIRFIAEAYRKLAKAYEGSGITFCPCEEITEEGGDKTGVAFPFVEGRSLQEILEQAVREKDEGAVEHILKEYVRRILSFGGEEPFAVTPEFVQVFGEVSFDEPLFCAAASDIDMIFSNILVEEGEAYEPDTEWNVIDYEWTFDFPIPKIFVIYRALYFACYQILNGTEWSLEALLALAGITEKQREVFKGMEARFQEYLGTGALPVRNMQRIMGTKIVSLEQLLGRTETAGIASGDVAMESEWIKVRKLQYHIDRKEYQDGSVICSGWAFASTWDGRKLPVNIRVTDEKGRAVLAEIGRRERKDVAETLKIRNVTTPLWGFDCVWIAPPREGWKISFSLGNQEKVYEG